MTHNILRTFSGATRVPVIFTNADTTTSGDWSAVYRADVYKIAGWTPDSLPGYASSVTVQGHTPEEWPSQSGDARALLRPGSATPRIAAAWTTTDSQNSTFTIDLVFTDTTKHQVALYCVDWLGAATLQRMEVFDGATDPSLSNPLDTRELLMPPNGVYFVWKLSGQSPGNPKLDAVESTWETSRKFESRNPKQILNSKFKTTRPGAFWRLANENPAASHWSELFGIPVFGFPHFPYSNLFRISDFGLRI